VRAGHALADQVADPRNPQHREILEGRKWPLSSGQQWFNIAGLELAEREIAGLELAERELTDIDQIGRNSSVGAPDHAGAAASNLPGATANRAWRWR
jgi:hypothetical protein